MTPPQRTVTVERLEGLNHLWTTRHAQAPHVMIGLQSRELCPETSIPGHFTVTHEGVVHGRGVISERAFAVDEPIILGTGTIVRHDTEAPDDALRHVYCMDAGGSNRDGDSFDFHMTGPGANLVKYVNSADDRVKSNCQIKWHGMAVPVLYCTAPISPGDELLADYMC